MAGALVLMLAAAGCGSPLPPRHVGTRRASGARRVPATTVPAATVPATTTAPPPSDPGTLPQTSQVPAAGTAPFDADMADLWQGVVTGTVGPAMAAFFPEQAYLQVKTLANPAADWQDRLVAEYAADIGAAHQLLGADPGAATLVTVDVPGSYAHWVPPGVCDNGVGYWEVPNARMVYRINGQERSFGIASMISWRGVWYVVHLGAVLRSGPGGEVDDPSTGVGTPAPSSTC